MPWANRPGNPPEERLEELEKTFGIENLKNVKIEEDGGVRYMYIYAQDKKYRVQLTEV